MKTKLFALRTTSLTFFLTGVTLLSPLAFAGNSDGGGGKAVVCRYLVDTGKFTQPVELLDLYESQVKYDEPAQQDSRDFLTQAKEAWIRLRPALPDDVTLLEPEQVYSRMKILSKIKLAWTDDSYEMVLPQGCEVEQLANYTSEGIIFVQKSLWDAMNNTNKAALLIHESLYRTFRGPLYRHTNSNRARKAVGHVFNGHTYVKPPATPPTELPEGSYLCLPGDEHGPSTEFENGQYFFTSHVWPSMLHSHFANMIAYPNSSGMGFRFIPSPQFAFGTVEFEGPDPKKLKQNPTSNFSALLGELVFNDIWIGSRIYNLRRTEKINDDKTHIAIADSFMITMEILNEDQKSIPEKFPQFYKDWSICLPKSAFID